MNKDMLWILVIGFVLGFISREQWNEKSWLFIFQAMQAFLVPFALVIWAWYSEKQKDTIEQERIEDREEKERLQFLFTFINKEIFPILEKVDQLNIDNYIFILETYRIRFLNFQHYQGGYYKREKFNSDTDFANFIIQWSTFAERLKELMTIYKKITTPMTGIVTPKTIFKEYLTICCEMENYLDLYAGGLWATKLTGILNKCSVWEEPYRKDLEDLTDSWEKMVGLENLALLKEDLKTIIDIEKQQEPK